MAAKSEGKKHEGAESPAMKKSEMKSDHKMMPKRKMKGKRC